MPHNLHPAGQFDDAVIIDHGYSKAKTGTVQLFVVFETTADKITGFFALTDKAIEYTLKNIRAMGFDGERLEDLADGKAMDGNLCQIQVDHEEWNGKTRAKVSWVNPVGAGGGGIERDADGPAVASRFNALLRKEPVVPKAVKGGTAPPNNPTNPTPEGPADDEIPF